MITTNRTGRLVTLAIAFAAFLFAADCSGVMIVQGFTEERHDRFAARTDPADFVASGFDLSGVGRATSGWVTLLANPTGGAVKHFASAHHAQPSGNVSFFPGNDPTATPVVCTVASGGSRIGVSDIWIGSLDLSTCDTSSLMGYEIADPSGTNHVGDTILQAGISVITYATGVKTTNMRFGQNKVTTFHPGEEFISRTGDWVIYDDDSADGDLLAPKTANVANDLDPDETAFQGGDSGGPSFFVGGAGIKLFGIHSFKGTYNTNDADGDGNVDKDANGDEIETPVRRLSGDAYLPSSRAEILAITSVPEPNAFALLTLLAGVSILCRVNQRARFVV